MSNEIATVPFGLVTPDSDDEVLASATGKLAMRAVGSPFRREWQAWIDTVAWATRDAGVTPGRLLRQLSRIERRIAGSGFMVGLGLARGPGPDAPFIMATMSAEESGTCVELLQQLYATTFQGAPASGIPVTVPAWSDQPWNVATVQGPTTLQ